MPRHELEPSQKRQLEGWIEEVRQLEDVALKWANTLYKIKRSGFWESTHDTWPDFCEEHFGYQKAMAYRYVACGEILHKHREKIAKEASPPKTVREIENYGKSPTVRQANVEYVGTEVAKEPKPTKQVSAKVDHESPMHYSRPVPMPQNLADTVNEIVREAMRLQNSGPAVFHEPAFRHLMARLLGLQKLVQPDLPGWGTELGAPAEPPPAKKARCTEAEAKAYCKTLGLPESDGKWFFDKMEGAGWRNGGHAVKDCYATMRAWEGAGYMASQKRQNSGRQLPEPEKHWSTKETERELARLRAGK